MKKTAFLFLLGLILFSCEKENQIIQENLDIPLIERILTNGNAFVIYTYTDANLLSEEKSKFHYTKHNYNGNNTLSSSEFYMDPAMFSSNYSVVEASMNRKEWVSPENTEKSLTQTFDYNNQEQCTKKIYIRPSTDNPEYLEFTWENDRIIRQTMYWKNERSGYIDFYYDNNGNMEKKIKYTILPSGVTELSTTTEYEFDGMHNPYLAFKRLMTPGKYTNPNNILKETYTIHFEVDPWIDKVQVTEYSYSYNELGYPVRVNKDTEYIYK